MFDEPSAGLSLILVERVLGVINQLKNPGPRLAEWLVEKALTVAVRVCAMAKGEKDLESHSSELKSARAAEAGIFWRCQAAGNNVGVNARPDLTGAS
jgi:branched-chain amino acid transport system ATP-binding protein